MKFMLGVILCSLGIAVIVSDLCYQLVGVMVGDTVAIAEALLHMCIVAAGAVVGYFGAQMLEDDDDENA